MDDNTFTVKGVVQIYSGNQMDINEVKPILKKSYKVLAVEGVHAHKGKPDIKLNYLDSYYEIINTKKNGEFQIDLKQGIYTFFILKGDKVYLNNFDGFGNFSHIEVKDNTKNIVIKDDQNAYF
tara:strand:- start:99 stop:467 length:369 start_codon:yes stop_codon:yes gene_type:complete